MQLEDLTKLAEQLKKVMLGRKLEAVEPDADGLGLRLVFSGHMPGQQVVLRLGQDATVPNRLLCTVDVENPEDVDNYQLCHSLGWKLEKKPTS